MTGVWCAEEDEDDDDAPTPVTPLNSSETGMETPFANLGAAPKPEEGLSMDAERANPNLDRCRPDIEPSSGSAGTPPRPGGRPTMPASTMGEAVFVLLSPGGALSPVAAGEAVPDARPDARAWCVRSSARGSASPKASEPMAKGSNGPWYFASSASSAANGCKSVPAAALALDAGKAGLNIISRVSDRKSGEPDLLVLLLCVADVPKPSSKATPPTVSPLRSFPLGEVDVGEEGRLKWKLRPSPKVSRVRSNSLTGVSGRVPVLVDGRPSPGGSDNAGREEVEADGSEVGGVGGAMTVLVELDDNSGRAGPSTDRDC